jgi:DNA-binding SARP family transcriptional activator/transposase-like protein
MGLLRLALFGQPEVFHDERRLTFSLRKAQALLFYLAVEGGMHSRSKLAAFFWPDSTSHDARTALRNALALLRSLLDDTEGSNPHLLREGELLGLNTQTLLELDFMAVQQAYTDAQNLSSETSRLAQLTHVQHALSLVRGSFLDGFWLGEDAPFDEWHEQQRRHWEVCLLFLLDRLSSWYHEAGEQERAIATLQRWLALDPLSEEASRRLMQAYLILGDTSTALQVYTTCKARLAEALQVRPSQETLALAQRIRTLAAHAELPTVRSTGPQTGEVIVPLVGRGEAFTQLTRCYRLVQMAQPQAVFVIGEPGIGKTRLSSEFLAWAGADGADVLQGRAFETGSLLYQPFVDALRPRLEQENAPEDLLDDLWLAELSRLLPELRVRYPDLPVPNNDALMSRMLLFEAVAQLLDALAQRAPLVFLLDDLHWMDEASQELLRYLVRFWIRQSTRVLLLGTIRREEVELNPQLVIQLAALERDLPVTRVTLQTLSQEETFQLVRALTRIDEQGTSEGEALPLASDPAQLTAIGSGRAPMMKWEGQLTRLDEVLFARTNGHPLYLLETLKLLRDRQWLVSRLGADRTWKLEPTPQMALALAEPLSQRELLPSSVQAMIQARLTKLTPTTRQLVMAGAVLGKQASITLLWHVAEIQAQEGIEALAEAIASGLLREEEAEGGRTSTYRFTHGLICDVVYSELGEARRRVLHQQTLKLLQSEGVQASILAYHAGAAGEAEMAFRYHVQAGDEALAVFAIPNAIGYYERARLFLQNQSLQQEVPDAGEVEYLYVSLARAYAFQNAYEQARKTYEELLAYAQQHSWPALVSMTLNHLAILAVQQAKEQAEVHALLAEAWRMAQISQNPRVLAETAWNRLQILGLLWETPTLALAYGDPVELARAIPDKELEAKSLSSLGTISLIKGDFQASISFVEAALALYADLDDHPGASHKLSLTSFMGGSSPTQPLTNLAKQALCWGSISMAQAQTRPMHNSIRSARKALEHARESKNSWVSVISVAVLAQGLPDVGAYEEALGLLQETLVLARALPPSVNVQRFLLAQGSLSHALQWWEEARTALEEADALAQASGLKLLHVSTLSQLCMNAVVAGEWERAYQYALKAIALRRSYDAPVIAFDFFQHYETEALLRNGDERLAREEVQQTGECLGSFLRFHLPYLRSRALLAVWDGETGQAIDDLNQAARIAADLGLPTDQWQILATLGRVYELANDPGQAHTAFREAQALIEGLAEGINDRELRVTFLAGRQIQQMMQQAPIGTFPASKEQVLQELAMRGTDEQTRLVEEVSSLQEASQGAIPAHCPHCGSDTLIRDGRAPNGKQKYRCQACGRRSREQPAPNAYPDAHRKEILHAYREEGSMRGLTRDFGVSRTTLSHWLRKR